MYRVLIVDDNIQIRFGIKSFIQEQDFGFDEIQLGEDGVDAMELLKSFKPDLILTDIKMPRMDGISLANEVKKSNPGIKIIFGSTINFVPETNLVVSTGNNKKFCDSCYQRYGNLIL